MTKGNITTMDNQLTTGAIAMLQVLQASSNTMTEAERNGISPYQVLADAYLTIGVKLAKGEDRGSHISPLEQIAVHHCPGVEHIEVTEANGSGYWALKLYGKHTRETITIGLGVAHALFEDAWANGYLEEMLTPEQVSRAGLGGFSAKIYNLAMERERHDIGIG